MRLIRWFWVVFLFAAVGGFTGETPNIVYVLCDDLGYGDVQCLNPQRGKIKTPVLDKLAADGMRFTDAHSGSAVCTPTRYGLMTGRYSWRTKLQSGVLYGYGAPLISSERATVASFLKQHGYKTACIGKWHLGMTLPETNLGGDPIPNGPTVHGFDYFFGISASLDMPPYAFIHNDRFTKPLDSKRKYIREGPAASDFEAVDVLPTLTRKSVEFINSMKEMGDRKPFFLYVPLASPHTPVVPSPEWKGKSEIGEYGDFVMQTDAAIGEILAALEKNGIAENTLVIVTSDNGCAPAAGTEKLEAQGHFASEKFRGYKADLFEGGHRVPFIARWPKVVKPGGVCEQTICLTDLFATCAEILEQKIPDNAAEDSVSILPLLKGEGKATREATVHHSVSGHFAIRQGQWKLAFSAGSGGWSKPKEQEAKKSGLPATQLYDLNADPAETKNVAAEYPDVVERLTKLLETYVANGRSTPGAAQKNDAEVKIRK